MALRGGMLGFVAVRVLGGTAEPEPETAAADDTVGLAAEEDEAPLAAAATIEDWRACSACSRCERFRTRGSEWAADTVFKKSRARPRVVLAAIVREPSRKRE